MRSRVWLASAGGVAVAVLLLAWAFDRAGGARFTEALDDLATWILVPALVCEVTVWGCKAWKWTGILASTKRVRYLSALRALLVGGAATHLVPLRIDELLRAKILLRPRPSSLAGQARAPRCCTASRRSCRSSLTVSDLCPGAWTWWWSSSPPRASGSRPS